MTTIDCAPDYSLAGRHAMSPQLAHDDIARFNFLANFNKFMANSVVSGNALAYEHRAKPAYLAANGRSPKDRREIREAMKADGYYRTWSSLRRNAMEMRQHAGRSLVLRQAGALTQRAATINANASTLQLDPQLPVPRYQSAVDNHCMPGSYYAQLGLQDVSAAANYDVGMFATTTGLFGRFLDGAGRGTAEWLRKLRPGWQPKRILDIGCGLGHNTVPLARTFANAEVIAVDLAEPMLRYGHARARGMSVNNIVFKQANAERLDFPRGHFDFIYSSMFLHETSYAALRAILREVDRLLAPGGVQVHLEQPPYHGMAEFEKFLRDWRQPP